MENSFTIVLLFFTGTVLFVALKVLNWVWFEPKKMEKKLQEQGFKGNPYRLFHGDLKDMKKMLLEAHSKPVNGFSHAIEHRVVPLFQDAVQKYVANVDDLIHIDVDEEEESDQQIQEDSERTVSAIPGQGETSAQKETGDVAADSGEAAQNIVVALDPSVQIIPSVKENTTPVELDIPPTDPDSALTAVPLRSIPQKSKKRPRPSSSGTSSGDSSFNFEDMSADDFADSCYRLGKALHKKTSSMAKDISSLQHKVIQLNEANAKIASLEESNHEANAKVASLEEVHLADQREIEKLKSDLAKAEEQLNLRDQRLAKMDEEHLQHLATAKKMKADFDKTLRQMEEIPTQNIVQKVVAGYKSSPQTYEEIQIILAPALRRGYTLGVDEAKPADLVINSLPNHRLYDKKAGEIFTKRYDEYKNGEDIISKYAKKKSAQPSEKSAQPVEKPVQPSAPSTS